jgi:quercetin dioxygenase-like cupin family protein
MEIQAKQPTKRVGPPSFQGDIWADYLVKTEAPSRVRLASVHFSPGARTAWHRHALGQTLYVTEGVGYVQARGGDIITIRPGDVVYTPAGEWHWHGACPDHFMTHLSITEEDVDSTEPKTEWGEPVTDHEYAGR